MLETTFDDKRAACRMNACMPILADADWVLKPLVARLDAAEVIAGQLVAPCNVTALLRQRVLLTACQV